MGDDAQVKTTRSSEVEGVARVTSVFDAPAGKNRDLLGRATVILGEDDPREVYWKCERGGKPPWMRRGVALRFRGTLDESRKTPRLTLAACHPELSTAVLRGLQRNGMNLSPARRDTLFAKYGVLGVDDLLTAMEAASDPGEKGLLRDLVSLKENTEIAEIVTVFHGAGRTEIDLATAARVYYLLRYRAHRAKITVPGMIRRYPWTVLQAGCVELSRDVVNDLVRRYLNTTDPGVPLLAAYGAMMAAAAGAARRGDSYITYEKARGVIKKERDRYYGKSAYSGPEFHDVVHVHSEAGDPQVRSAMGRFVCENGKSGPGAEFVPLAMTDPMYARRSEKEVARELSAVYLSKAYHAERTAAERMVQIIEAGPRQELGDVLKRLLDGGPGGLSGEVRRDFTAISRDAGQLEALKSVFERPVSMVIGGAGSGKTTVLRLCALLAREMGLAPLVLAPSAIAAHRAASSLGVPYGTIHRYASITWEDEDLGAPDNGVETVHADTARADLVLVDEVFMLDCYTLSRLLQCLKTGVHVAFFGDDAQLPAMGPSGFAHQMARIGLKGLPVVRLERNYRSNSAVYRAAAALRTSGTLSETDVLTVETPCISDGVFVFEGKRSDGVTGAAKALFAHGVSWEDAMFLAATRGMPVAGVMGTIELNRRLRNEFNKTGVPVGDTGLRVGDPLVTTENDYAEVKRRMRPRRHPGRTVDVWNGLRGRVVSWNEPDGTAEIELDFGDKRLVLPYYLEELMFWTEPAYAMTVHKAQGGQADYVVVSGPEKMNGNMLYTAMTRARKGCLLIGPRKEWEAAAKRVSQPPKSKFAYRYQSLLAKVDRAREPADEGRLFKATVA